MASSQRTAAFSSPERKGMTMADDANEGSAAMRGSMAWIPVTERLPPDGVEVLVCGQSGAVDIGRHCGGRWIGHDQDFLAVYERGTHWMRLPEPPTKSHQHTSEDVVQHMAETDASLRDELSATNCGDRQSITLIDAEREAVERAIASFDSSDYPASNADADTLRRLLFRCAKDCEARHD